MLWILVGLLAFTAFGLSTGNARIQSGDTAVGGVKAWITSQFSNGLMLSLVIFLFYSFFVTIAAGLSVVRDDESRVGELLHSTPLTAGEYIWGKFAAVLAAFVGVMALHLVMTAFCNHLLPNARAAEIRGPFLLLNYLVPFAVFGLPSILFLAGTAFAVGERTRRPVLIFVIPLASIVFCAMFLWNWSPTWLDPRINRVLMLLDPAGFRWLNETWMKVDRGVKFYNEGRIGFDAPFLLSRLAFLAVGLLAVAYSRARFARTMRGLRKMSIRRRKAVAAPPLASDGSLPPPLAALGMRMRPPGLFRGMLEVARVEFRELIVSPGLYLFVPLILVQAAGEFMNVGALEAPILVTPGFAAARLMNTLTLLLCFLLLFYTVESLVRDQVTGLASIAHASPARSASILFGKALANSLVGAAVLLAAFLVCWVEVLVEGKVPFRVTPFLIVWGLLLLPTLLLWTSFASALFSVTRSRYVTYALALGAVALTAFLQFRDKMSWAGNWNLWSAVRWSDIGPLEMDRTALVLNRLLAVSLTVLFVAVAVRFFPRTAKDPTLVLRRLEPVPLLKSALGLAPFLLAPLVLGAVLGMKVHRGFEGSAAKEKAKDYWRQNLASWKEAPLPDLTAVELKLDLEPRRSSFRTEGTYRIVNRHEKPMAQVALTGDLHWKSVHWTLDGKPCEPKDRTHLYVFTPPTPIPRDEGITIGFSFEGVLPDGISKNGAGIQEFILPSGAVLTSFSPSVAPVVGYLEEVGVDEDNRYEPKDYPEDFHEGVTEPLFGSASSFTTRIAVTVPEEYRANSVGVLESETLAGGKRTSVWRSDSPVRFFNVVAGKWEVRRGEGTAVFHHPAHAVNVEEMSLALGGARKFYDAWFFPYPWKELKLSEFAAHSFYAQGFPTNITFSEGIGFLTKNDPRAATAFAITAHESAHQWWGNLLTPGKGPGGNIVSEGLAHYSAALLLEEMKGPLFAMEFRKRIEESYGNSRQSDSERPLVKVDGSKAGDRTVTYDKGGWAFFMLHDRMGRDAMLAGLRDFVGRYKDGPDFPVLQDLLAVLREHAPDGEDFDAFTKQWFHEVVVPEYRIAEADRKPAGPGWEVRVKVRNDGTGAMPLEVAAAKGDRMDDEGKPVPDYRDARLEVTLDAGEEKEVVIATDFEPDRVLVDPDVRVLQLKRNKAIRRF
jgi:ABC-type transport system involved in multi-copper enzyme maturation permease subunit